MTPKAKIDIHFILEPKYHAKLRKIAKKYDNSAHEFLRQKIDAEKV